MADAQKIPNFSTVSGPKKNYVLLPLSEFILAEAITLYQSRDDKEWGLTDCLSFVVMTQLGVSEALTADIHLRQAGFHALLLAP